MQRGQTTIELTFRELSDITRLVEDTSIINEASRSLATLCEDW